MLELKSGIKCPTCGDILKKQPDGKYRCPSCDNEYELGEKEVPSQIQVLLNSADAERRLHQFDRAQSMYDDIINQDSEQPLAYWGAFLSEYGVEYVESKSLVNTYTPIVHRLSRIPALQSPYLRKLFSICDTDKLFTYKSMAHEIENIRYSIYERSRTQEPCDIFICAGDSKSELYNANLLYKQLNNGQQKVFYPRVSVPAGAFAEEFVFPAIESARVMFIVAESLNTFAKTENTWSRFLDSKTENAVQKKIQVLHYGLNESDFPSRLRKTFQRQEPIDLNSVNWLRQAFDFAKKPEKEVHVENVSTTIINTIDESLLKRMVAQGRTATSLSEAMAMVLSALTVGDADGANRIIYEQFDKLGGRHLTPMAELCTELTRLRRDLPQNRPYHMNNIKNIGYKIRTTYPRLTLLERGTYGDIKNATLLIYLAKCFGAMKDRARQCYVLDMIDTSNIFNTRTITDLVQMLLANGRMDEVNDLLRSIRHVDGDSILMPYLNQAQNDERKILTLYSVAPKIKCTDAISDDINRYLSDLDNLGVALAVVEILNRNNVEITQLGLNGILSSIMTKDSMELLLKNYGKHRLTSSVIDKLVQIGADGGAEVANCVLRHLRFEANISNLGQFNMQYLLNKCGLEDIGTAFFSFDIDKKLVVNLLMSMINSNNPNRFFTVKELLNRVPDVDITIYERMLLSNDSLKVKLIEILAPKTVKMDRVSSVLEKYLKGYDSDETKREVIECYSLDQYNDKVLSLYVNLIPEMYYDKYIDRLNEYLKNAQGEELRKLFVDSYRQLPFGYENVLLKIVQTLQYFNESVVVDFVKDFKGTQTIKDQLFKYMIPYLDKIKKMQVVYKTVSVNLSQAYLLTMRDASSSQTMDIIKTLEKKGASVGDKVLVDGKKQKFGEFAYNAGLNHSVIEFIQTII